MIHQEAQQQTTCFNTQENLVTFLDLLNTEEILIPVSKQCMVLSNLVEHGNSYHLLCTLYMLCTL